MKRIKHKKITNKVLKLFNKLQIHTIKHSKMLTLKHSHPYKINQKIKILKININDQILFKKQLNSIECTFFF